MIDLPMKNEEYILTDGEVALAVPEKGDFQLDMINDPFVLLWASSPAFFYTDEEKATKRQ